MAASVKTSVKSIVESLVSRYDNHLAAGRSQCAINK